jgi:hypothetical protein
MAMLPSSSKNNRSLSLSRARSLSQGPLCEIMTTSLQKLNKKIKEWELINSFVKHSTLEAMAKLPASTS